MERVGITALVPPELIYGCGKIPCDINNFVPESKAYPKSKLCAWTAIWRDMVLNKKINLSSLVVVAGGDCHNTLVDGQKIALSGLKTFYFFYPFNNDPEYLKDQLRNLEDFLGGFKNRKLVKRIVKIKKYGEFLDRKRADGKISASKIFKLLISSSDFSGDINRFETALRKIKLENLKEMNHVALIGVPPIYPDFHKVAEDLGLHIVFDELPYEFIRLKGETIDEMAKSYCNYTFARELKFRFRFLQKELTRRKIDGIIHYTQYACHHILEDEVFRREFDYPMLTIQGDLPRVTPEQVKLRLEAFAEMLGRR